MHVPWIEASAGGSGEDSNGGKGLSVWQHLVQSAAGGIPRTCLSPGSALASEDLNLLASFKFATSANNRPRFNSCGWLEPRTHHLSLACDRGHGQVIEGGSLETGEQMRGARTAGRQANSELGREFGVGSRHERRHFCVPYLEERDAWLFPLSTLKRPRVGPLIPSPEYPSMRLTSQALGRVTKQSLVVMAVRQAL
jgi:hypothetical protein